MSIYIDIHTGLKKRRLKNASLLFITIFSVLKRRNKDIKQRDGRKGLIQVFFSVIGLERNLELLSFHLCFLNGRLGSINAQRSFSAFPLWEGSFRLWARKNLMIAEKNVTYLCRLIQIRPTSTKIATHTNVPFQQRYTFSNLKDDRLMIRPRAKHRIQTSQQYTGRITTLLCNIELFFHLILTKCLLVSCWKTTSICYA